MKRIYLSIALVCLTLFVWSQNDYKIYESFDKLQDTIHQSKEQVVVVNFWATWCAPCVRELPYFEQLRQDFSKDELRIVLVSLDFKRQLEKNLVPFLEKNEINSEVCVLLDTKESIWIDKIDPKWSGAIPATLIISGDKRKFIEGEIHDYKELTSIIESFKN